MLCRPPLLSSFPTPSPLRRVIAQPELMATGAVGAAGLLAACGSKPAASSTASSAAASQAPAASADESLALSDGPVNLSISWWGGDSRHAAYQSALEAFQAEHSNITVEPEKQQRKKRWKKQRACCRRQPADLQHRQRR